LRLFLYDGSDIFNRKFFLKSRIRFTAAAFSLALLMASPVSSAFKLGDLQGAALIGRTLDVAVQVQAAPGEDVSASCFSADVFYAEAQQRVPQVSLGALSPDSAALLRVQLDEPVSETFVTVVLTSRCGSTNSRRYVLLADIPQSPAGASAPALIVLPPRATQSVAEVASVGAASVDQRQTAPVAQKPRAVAPENTVKPVKKTAVKAVSNKPAQLKAGAIGKARLKLDAMAFLSDRMDSLDSPMVFAPTEDTLLHAKQIAGLESDLKNLRQQTASSELKLLEMQTQLQLSQSQQIPMWMIYAGAAALLISLLALAWLWQRQLSAAKNDWWQDPDKEDEPSTLLASRAPDTRQDGFTHTVQAAPTIVLTQAPVAVSTMATAPAAAPAVDLDITTGSFMLSSSKRATEQTDASRSTKGHHLMAEDVLDIRQQADFFVSLGQTERALDILCKHISQANDPNPLLHLDLIALYHALGMKSDFYAQREVFARHFNGTIPEFADFTHESKSLEGYPEVLAELTRLWPNVQAFTYVDACIYRDEQEQGESFDLAAFRDLLTLHALAEVVATETTILPVKAAAPVKPKKNAPPIAAVEAASSIAPLPDLPIPPQLKRVTVPPVDALTVAPVANIPLVSDAELLASLPSAFANFELHPAPVVAPEPVLAPAPALELDFETEAIAEVVTKHDQSSLNEHVPVTFAQTLTVSEPEPEPESEVPTRMLDLDFSNLDGTKVVAPSAEPAPSAAAARYATRSRWPVTKKPSKNE